MKVKLREMLNAHRVCLPMNVVAQEANYIQFSEQDKAKVVYPNADLLVIKLKIME